MQLFKISSMSGRALIVGSAIMLSAGAAGIADAKEFVVGFQCDRSGPTQTVGAFLCDGAHDYIRLANKKQMFGPGNTVRLFEIDHAYNVPRGVEAYERHKAAGQVTQAVYGTPHIYSLTPRLTKDKIPGTSPGFGAAGAANGKEYPYVFPIAATYWSQAAAAVKFVMDKWQAEGKSGTLKVAYIYYDNPAGREPLPVLRDLQKRLGFTMREFAVPSPGIEMRPQVLDIVRNYKADWVISHLFWRAPGVSLKEFTRLRFPLDHVLGFVWAGGESDINVAGWDKSQGSSTLQFAGLGQDHDVIREIQQMYKDEGKPPQEKMKISVYYNRGVFIASLHARAIQLAIEKHGNDITGVHTKEGFENINNFTLGGFLPPLNITAADHEGGGWVQVWKVEGTKWVKASDWFHGYRDVVLEHVAKAKAPQ